MDSLVKSVLENRPLIHPIRPPDSGTLWKVKRDMFLPLDAHSYPKLKGRKILVAEDEIIEFRFSENVHFRTTDDIYLRADMEYFYEHCVFYGRIWEKIRNHNMASLAEILRLELFNQATPGDDGIEKTFKFQP